MKRRDLIRLIEKAGCELLREGVITASMPTAAKGNSISSRNILFVPFFTGRPDT